MKKIFENKLIVSIICLSISFLIIVMSLINFADHYFYYRESELVYFKSFIHGLVRFDGHINIFDLNSNILYGLGLVFFLLILVVLTLNVIRFFIKNNEKIISKITNVVQIVTSIVYGFIAVIILCGNMFKPDGTICNHSLFFDSNVSLNVLPYCSEYRLGVGGFIILVLVLLLLDVSILSLAYTKKKKGKK